MSESTFTPRGWRARYSAQMSESTFTPHQRALLDQAIALGYGYRRFALSVVRQGSCSPKQEDALASMVALGEYRKANWSGVGKYKNRQYI